jgi:hypothetical protein
MSPVCRWVELMLLLLLLLEVVGRVGGACRVAGDCVNQGPGAHGCKGLSQEKAYVTSLQVG